MESRKQSTTKSRLLSEKQTNDRLAKALRDNLHRRKVQARARKKNSLLAESAKSFSIDDGGMMQNTPITKNGVPKADG